MSDGSYPAALKGRQAVVVTLPSEIDVTNEGQVRAALVRPLAGKPEVVIADGTRTEFCDCAAITGLISAHERAATEKAQLRVVMTSTRVLRVIELVGAGEVLSVYPTVRDALMDGNSGAFDPEYGAGGGARRPGYPSASGNLAGLPPAGKHNRQSRCETSSRGFHRVHADELPG